ncbi:hypothetical protein [Thermococcus sp.]|uniref:hypothetical protein n=1 Tax=Thermococcus sp. TaxID=35749 RepID=UPI0025D58FD7|nr:hypothetical protein [Thermococcus sp.]
MEVKRYAYYLFTALLWFAAFSALSAYLSMNGVSLPWVKHLDGGYQVNLVPALVFGGFVGLLVAHAGRLLSQRSGNPTYYYAGPLVAIVVISLTVLLLYGGACGYCKKVVCSPNPVKECGIDVRLSWTLFKIKCVCAALVARLLAFL